jgi:hypothetical protein
LRDQWIYQTGKEASITCILGTVFMEQILGSLALDAG